MWSGSLLLIATLRLFVLIWDGLTYPFYYAFFYNGSPRNKVRARIRHRTSSDKSITISTDQFSCKIRDEYVSQGYSIDTLNQLLDFIVKKHGKKECLGTRPLISQRKEMEKDGSIRTKCELGPFSWITYDDVRKQCMRFGFGLQRLGFKPGDKIVIFSETRAEWLVSAMSCFYHGYPIVTIYTNLGADGIAYGLNQTDAKVVITSQELLPKLKSILKQVVHVHTIIHFGKEDECDDDDKASSTNTYSFHEVQEMGESFQNKPLPKIKPDDIAVIMYTSGSTGNPKAALLSHRNVCTSIIGSCPFTCDFLGEDETQDCRYLAYLPLAHIFELTLEIVMMMKGCQIGYSGPNTLTDTGTMVPKGQKGDARELRPSMIIAVPVILDRIYKGIRAKVAERGPLFKEFFQFWYEYRRWWVSKGFDTPIANKLIFSSCREILGGRILAIVGGGAPLSSEVHEFLQTILGVNISQGYGLTETCGGVTLSYKNDLNTGEVGHPLNGAYLKLVNWDEGGYTINDAVGPRGEIHIGGPRVSMGYYNLPDKTVESFYVDDEGMKWFKTGDIGQLTSTGAFKIIDRKKDLVKLQMGEYVSLGKVEGIWKVHPVVESVCAYGDSSKYSVVSIIVPDPKVLKSLAEERLGLFDVSYEKLCKNTQLTEHVLKSLQEHSKGKLEKFEIPKGLCLTSNAWTPESNFVTAALKLKRKPIQIAFQKEIDMMYAKM